MLEQARSVQPVILILNDWGIYYKYLSFDDQEDWTTPNAFLDCDEVRTMLNSLPRYLFLQEDFWQQVLKFDQNFAVYGAN